jgi:hypothetical protein
MPLENSTFALNNTFNNFNSSATPSFFQLNTTDPCLNSTNNELIECLTSITQSFLTTYSSPISSQISEMYNGFIDYLFNKTQSLLPALPAFLEFINCATVQLCENLQAMRDKTILRIAKIPLQELARKIGSVDPNNHPHVRDIDKMLQDYRCRAQLQNCR